MSAVPVLNTDRLILRGHVGRRGGDAARRASSRRKMASLRVAEKVGFCVAHHTTYKDEPTELLFRDPDRRFK